MSKSTRILVVSSEDPRSRGGGSHRISEHLPVLMGMGEVQLLVPTSGGNFLSGRQLSLEFALVGGADVSQY